MVEGTFILPILTAAVTLTSILMIVYTYIRNLSYDYKNREGVSNEQYEKWSKRIAVATIVGLISAIFLLFGVATSDPIYLSQNIDIPATLTGIGFTLFFGEIILLLFGFIALANEELR